jgi:hypothetical protein
VAVSFVDVYDRIDMALEGLGNLHPSERLVEPTSAPANLADGAYSSRLGSDIHPEAPGRWKDNGRCLSSLEIMWARRTNVAQHRKTERQVYTDQGQILERLMATDKDWSRPLTVRFVSADPPLYHPSREWTFGRMRFTVDFLVELS